MTTQIETTIQEQNPTRWQKLVAWFEAFGEAIDYDPAANARANNRRLRDKIDLLETRLGDLEQRNRRAA